MALDARVDAVVGSPFSAAEVAGLGAVLHVPARFDVGRQHAPPHDRDPLDCRDHAPPSAITGAVSRSHELLGEALIRLHQFLVCRRLGALLLTSSARVLPSAFTTLARLSKQASICKKSKSSASPPAPPTGGSRLLRGGFLRGGVGVRAGKALAPAGLPLADARLPLGGAVEFFPLLPRFLGGIHILPILVRPGKLLCLKHGRDRDVEEVVVVNGVATPLLHASSALLGILHHINILGDARHEGIVPLNFVEERDSVDGVRAQAAGLEVVEEGFGGDLRVEGAAVFQLADPGVIHLGQDEAASLSLGGEIGLVVRNEDAMLRLEFAMHAGGGVIGDGAVGAWASGDLEGLPIVGDVVRLVFDEADEVVDAVGPIVGDLQQQRVDRFTKAMEVEVVWLPHDGRQRL